MLHLFRAVGLVLALRKFDLEKKLNDLSPGKSRGKTPYARHDYSHLLDPQHRAAGYRLNAVLNRDDTYRVSLTHSSKGLQHRKDNGGGLHPGEVGFLHGYIERNKALEMRGQQGSAYADFANAPGSHFLEMSHSYIHDDHRGKGLAIPLFEAALIHGRQMGATHAGTVGKHSTMAMKPLVRLSTKHGLDYRPDESIPNRFPDGQKNVTAYREAPSGPYDDKYAPFSFPLTS